MSASDSSLNVKTFHIIGNAIGPPVVRYLFNRAGLTEF